MTETGSYIGTELDLFANATNWKSYWLGKISPYLQGRVLEVGAGSGANTVFMLARSGNVSQWHCIEPDSRLAGQIRERKLRCANGHEVEVAIGTLADLSEREKFQAILYIDVLEHIQHDQAELQRAARHLSPGGRLIILSPAHKALFSKFDASIGHFRRYSLASLEKVVPPSLKKLDLCYLDSCGFFASFANRWLLRQSMPTKMQISIWDKILVTGSRVLDPLSAYSFGKSVLGVWEQS